MKTLPPYYYPTMALLVDDNSHFLEGISFKLSDKLAYQLYDKPYQLLQFLKEEYHEKVRPSSNITTYNLQNVKTQIYNKKKYNEISVILVDYSMPSINGLDFCQQLESFPIKKILVTGEGDYEIAVRAFNKRLIQKFIRKDDYDFAKKMNEYIFEMQSAYFIEISNTKNSSLAKQFPFFNDTLFYDFFMHLFNEHNIVEFYFLEELQGFLLLDIDVNPSILLIRNENELVNEDMSPASLNIKDNANLNPFISLAHLPSELLDTVVISTQCVPATKLKTEKTYYYSIIDQKKSFIDPSRIISYRQYLGL